LTVKVVGVMCGGDVQAVNTITEENARIISQEKK